MQNAATFVEGIWQYLAKLHMHLLFVPEILLLEIYPKDSLAKIYSSLCAELLMTALFVPPEVEATQMPVSRGLW